ncbi:hypothetical protein [Streptomyces erythrochromogenes]|uniref:hypothetical protein n=1 Tax=Streptomyces erythrochromogenes TaxID=285574 RepID=UPI0036926E89
MSGTNRSRIWAVIGTSLVAIGLLIRLATTWGGDDALPSPSGSMPLPDASAVTAAPGTYPPPRSLCEKVDFTEFAQVFKPQGASDGYNTGLEPEVVSGSMCKQSMSRTGTGVVKVSVLCSAYRDPGKAVEAFDSLRGFYGPPEAVSGLGDEAYRYRASKSPTVAMKVRDDNLDCQVEAEPNPPLDDSETESSFTAMHQLLATLIPKLAH